MEFDVKPIFLLYLMCLVTYVKPATNYILAPAFEIDSDHPLQVMIQNDDNGDIIVGGVNEIYRISSNLNIQQTRRTGPQMDNAQCPPRDCDLPTYERDYYLRAIAIDKDHGRLITCANLFAGRCEHRDINTMEKLDQGIREVVVPGDEVSSTVIFIAPGPNEVDGLHRNELYVGSTRSTLGNDLYLDNVPTISTRDLNDFSIAYKGIIQGGTSISLLWQFRKLLRIDYIHGFSSKGFSYFMTQQLEQVGVSKLDERYISKLVRVCQNDQHYSSYAEMKLDCHSEGVDFNILRAAHVIQPGSNLAKELGISHLKPSTEDEDVLFAVYSRGQGNTKYAEADSAICMYPLKNIRTRFTEAIMQCFNGQGNTGPSYIKQVIPCAKSQYEIDDDYCGNHGDSNSPIDVSDAHQSSAVIRLAGVNATSITMTTVHNYTVALVGTTDGTLRKIVIESPRKATPYEEVDVDPGSIVNKDMFVSLDKESVYVMTEKKVTKVKLHECGQYATCGTCLNARDPYCGWCVLENKCTKMDMCSKAGQAHYWLPYFGATCTRITALSPDKVQIKSVETTRLLLTIENMPAISFNNSECGFEGYGKSLTTLVRDIQKGPTSVDETIITCDTPEHNTLPHIPTGKDHIVMKLSVKISGREFVHTNFTFYDCTLHSSCSSCTLSEFPCTWCVQDHRCTSDREICRNDILITGKNVPGTSDTPGPDNCPLINGTSRDILVPSGTEKKIQVQGVNLKLFHEDFRCSFNIDGVREVSARKIEGTDTIECDAVYFQYKSDVASRNVPFKITWGGDENSLDNPENIQVKIYKCKALANNCGNCLTLDRHYECGWCSRDGVCSIGSQCGLTDWLDFTNDCRDPTITSFSPSTGPLKGGTLVTILGQSLGKEFSDISAGVTVAGKPCVPVESEYQPPNRIVCITSDVRHSRKNPVTVVIDKTYTASSSNSYAYVDPKITGLNPTQGPLSGGTRLTIKGQHMNTGSNISVKVLDRECTVISTSQNKTVCITSDGDAVSEGRVEVTFDNQVVTSNGTFKYSKDPEVVDVFPEKGILSGGIRNTVNGLYFDAVQNPRMYFRVGGKDFYSTCNPRVEYEIICISPDLSGAVLPRPPTADQPLELSYGFEMDNVLPLRNITLASAGIRLFRFYPDPYFYPFEDGVKYYQTDYLTINGAYLNLVLTKDDVIVKVGKARCNVTSMALEQLTCKPPSSSQEGVGSNPEVVVYAGNLTFAIGKLKYDVALSKLSLPTIIGICAGIGFLLVILIIVFIAYRRKSQERDRVYKHMQNQMDMLEAKVAKECKEAFAELQTDITDVTGDLQGRHGIPYRDFRDFANRVLFPGPESENPLNRHRDLGVDFSHRNNIAQGLHIFNVKLLHNQTFLLTFVRALEANQRFSMRDKVKVASLLSVALLDRMDYQTHILKTLLADLIEKAVEGRSHPKLLLRRTESVAEKMLTNWFTFLLYKFLRESSGEPLFTLYRAIKQHVEKGPIDAITSEAKYSLSEDKLIRQQIEYRPLTIYVIDGNMHYEAQQIPVKVLDVDTISQTKKKILDAIHRNTPYSDRPHKNDIDLEWHNGNRGRVILQDDDQTTKPEGDRRQLNTLAHYGIPDGALFALLSKQSSMYNLSLGSSRSGSHSKFEIYGMTGSPTLTRALSPNQIHLDMENGNTKYYHLVKHPDLDIQREGDRGSKMVSEIYLTRLLATKVTLQQFVDDLFETIFSTATRNSALPIAIKYLFDFLDDQAVHHNITDPEVVHTWKSNSLPLRFWVNVVKNPEFVFNIHKSNIVDSCLSVVAQTFMDSCSMSDHRLGKDSPSSKLLYAKDIPKYKKWVERYYSDIKAMPQISDQDMNALLTDESMSHKTDFRLNDALYELYQYVSKYYNEIMDALEDDQFARDHRLTYKMEEVRAYLHNYQSDV